MTTGGGGFAPLLGAALLALSACVPVGMTGTADTEAFEFQQIYGLEVIVIPTNKPMIREDKDDLIFRTKKEKLAAIVRDVAEIYGGSVSLDESEDLGGLLVNLRLPAARV